MGKTLDGLGADGKWKVRRLCVWRADITAEDNCEPVDISGATVRAVITASADDAVPIKNFTAVIDDGPAGQFHIQIDDTDATLAAGVYWWAMEWNVGYGDEPLVSGPFIVQDWIIPA
jgi:hypothetical protein